MSAKQAGSITGWANGIGNRRIGFWGLTPPLQTSQWIIRDLVQHFTMPPCPLRIQGGCSWVCPQKMKNVTGDTGMICKWHAGNSKTRTLPASSRELATWGKESPELNKGCLRVSLGLTVREHTSCNTTVRANTTLRDQQSHWRPSGLLSCLGFLPFKASHTHWTEPPPRKSSYAVDDQSLYSPAGKLLFKPGPSTQLHPEHHSGAKSRGLFSVTAFPGLSGAIQMVKYCLLGCSPLLVATTLCKTLPPFSLTARVIVLECEDAPSFPPLKSYIGF